MRMIIKVWNKVSCNIRYSLIACLFTALGISLTLLLVAFKIIE